MIFLVQYDRLAGTLLRFDHYTTEQRTDAEQARLALELSLLGQDLAHEIVLLEADSEQALRRTHGRYFESLSGLIEASGILGAH